MSYEVRLLPRADVDVVRLPAFLDLDSPAAGARARSIILQAIESLRELPLRGRAVARSGYRELVAPFGRDAYILRYRVVGELVIVTRIRHSRERR